MWLASDSTGEEIAQKPAPDAPPQTDRGGTFGQHSAASVNESVFFLAGGK